MKNDKMSIIYANFICQISNVVPNTCLEYVSFLGELDMRLWKRLPEMKNKNIEYVMMTFMNTNREIISVYKNARNSLCIENVSVLMKPFCKYVLTYVLPVGIENSYNVQDLMASEFIRGPYKVARIDNINGRVIVYLHAQFLIKA